ncbi:MAG TPA: hypothetical protein VK582_18100 [Pyrinomonadaceae bacterium]|nr:hypothetical protein [Pyrinomonadaceae bacterium]
MAARKSPATNNHLQEAMALLIRNQAAFVEQIARNDQERLALQRTGDQRQLRHEEWQRKTEEGWHKMEEWQRKMEAWQRKSDERFDRIEADLLQLPNNIVQTILDQLPRIKKEIGFKST